MKGTNPMEYQLRKYKAHKELSEETRAFSAELWVNIHNASWIKSADCSNRGHGDPIFVRFINAQHEKMCAQHVDDLPLREPSKDAPDWEKKIGAIKLDVESFVDELCEKEERAAQLKRWARTVVLFRLEGDREDAYRTVKVSKGQPREGAVKYVREKYGARVVEVV